MIHPALTFALFLFHMLPMPLLANIGTSFSALATLFANYLAGILAIVAVFNGYQILSAGEDVQQQTRAKRALGFSLAGAVLVKSAVALAPTIVGNIK